MQTTPMALEYKLGVMKVTVTQLQQVKHQL